MDNTRESIRALLKGVLQKNNDQGEFSDTESLILSGRLQSIDVLEIVVFLEERLGVDFSEGFDQSQLDSVEEIMKLLQSGIL